MDARQHAVTFHGPDGCHQLIDRKSILASYDHTDEDDNTLMYAHIVALEASPAPPDGLPEGEPDSLDEISSPTAALPPHKLATKITKTDKRKASTQLLSPNDIEDLVYPHDGIGTDEEDDIAFVRLGTHPWLQLNATDADAENQIEMEGFMVAEIDKKTETVCFVLVDSWTVNGVRLARFDMRELYKKVLFDSEGNALLWQPDRAFERCSSINDIELMAVAFIKDKQPPAHLVVSTTARNGAKTITQPRPLTTEPEEATHGEPEGLNRNEQPSCEEPRANRCSRRVPQPDWSRGGSEAASQPPTRAAIRRNLQAFHGVHAPHRRSREGEVAGSCAGFGEEVEGQVAGRYLGYAADSRHERAVRVDAAGWLDC